MANSAQLSLNNRNAQVWTNWNENTEKSFKICVADALEEAKQKYDLEFTHIRKVNNVKLTETFATYSQGHESYMNGSNGGGSNPDGGVIYVKGKDSSYPVFIGENKHQEDNPGNAIERSLKNISFFKNLLINEDYFPYLLNINGPIVNPRKGSYFDRISQDGGFMEVNKVFVKSNPATPRLRPFTILLDKDFDYDKVKQATLDIIDESISYLKSIDKL